MADCVYFFVAISYMPFISSRQRLTKDLGARGWASVPHFRTSLRTLNSWAEEKVMVRESYDAELEHRRLVERVGRTAERLADARETRPAVEVARGQLRGVADGAGALLHVRAPALAEPVGVLEAVLQALHVEVAEVQQVQVLPDVEIMPLDAVETRSPHAGFRDD